MTRPQAHLRGRVVLPRRTADPTWALEVPRSRQHRNLVAYRAHRTRRRAPLNGYHELSL